MEQDKRMIMKNLNLFTVLTMSIISTSSFCQQGTLDPTFGTGGIVTTPFPEDNDGEAVAIQDDGKIVVVGTSYTASNANIRVTRYLDDGALDNSFGTNGTVLFTTPSGGTAVVIQPDGKILVGGASGTVAGLDVYLARLNTDGTMDNSFGVNGSVLTDVGGTSDVLNAMALQSDGKIVIGGTTNSGGNVDFAVIRYNSDGTTDGSFGTGGIATFDISADDQEGEFVLIQSDGKILIGGSSWDDAALVRFDSTGNPDLSFGTNGYVTTDVALGYNDAVSGRIQSDGKIVVHGTAEILVGPLSVQSFSTIRYNSDGSLDQTFGSGGIVNTPMGNGDEANGTTMAIQSDGEIVVAGDAIVDNQRQFAMVRYLVDGTIDPGFGGGMGVLTEIGPYEDLCNSIALQPNSGEYIILVGESSDVMGDSDLALARYENTVGLVSFNVEDNPVHVYPNPITSESVIQYSLSGSEKVSVGLYNLAGELIQTILEDEMQKHGYHHLLLKIKSDLPGGNYLLKVETSSSIRSIEIHI